MCEHCKLYLSGQLRRVTTERDTARDQVAQLERDLDEARRSARIGREANAALSRAIVATVAVQQKERDALQAVIDSLLRDREPGEPVPSLQGECSGAGTVTCDEVVRMVWLGAWLYDAGEKRRGIGYSAVADAGRWLVLEHGPYTPQIAGVAISCCSGKQPGRERNRQAAEAEIVRQVHAVKPLVKFVFEEDL